MAFLVENETRGGRTSRLIGNQDARLNRKYAETSLRRHYDALRSGSYCYKEDKDQLVEGPNNKGFLELAFPFILAKPEVK